MALTSRMTCRRSGRGARGSLLALPPLPRLSAAALSGPGTSLAAVIVHQHCRMQPFRPGGRPAHRLLDGGDVGAVDGGEGQRGAGAVGEEHDGHAVLRAQQAQDALRTAATCRGAVLAEERGGGRSRQWDQGRAAPLGGPHERPATRSAACRGRTVSTSLATSIFWTAISERVARRERGDGRVRIGGAGVDAVRRARRRAAPSRALGGTRLPPSAPSGFPESRSSTNRTRLGEGRETGQGRAVGARGRERSGWRRPRETSGQASPPWQLAAPAARHSQPMDPLTSSSSTRSSGLRRNSEAWMPARRRGSGGGRQPHVVIAQMMGQMRGRGHPVQAFPRRSSRTRVQPHRHVELAGWRAPARGGVGQAAAAARGGGGGAQRVGRHSQRVERAEELVAGLAGVAGGVEVVLERRRRRRRRRR